MTAYDVAAQLPDIDLLRQRCKALAVLERIIDGCEPYYAYTSNWGGDEAASAEPALGRRVGRRDTGLGDCRSARHVRIVAARPAGPEAGRPPDGLRRREQGLAVDRGGRAAPESVMSTVVVVG
ncbi:hypothetical protein [Micromonospora sp. NPDC048947]|uniref:hypothetical protein n=1 Tax=Micromonospora sp. NPDC048947 TaxID=3154826 RepID=UPI0033C91EFC